MPLLLTCTVLVSAGGQQPRARALLDSGAMTSFVTRRLVKSLKAALIPHRTEVTVIEQMAALASTHQALLKLQSLHDPLSAVTYTAVVVDSITGDLPDWQMDGIMDCPELQNIPLADPDFNRPGRIDILLGMDVYQQVILEGQPLLNQQLKDTRSIFGWVITGSKYSPPTQAIAHLSLRTTTKDAETQDFLQKFWEVEQPLQTDPKLSHGEQLGVDHIHVHVKRGPDGRYQVGLQGIDTAASLGCSRDIALKRLIQNEKSFGRNKQLAPFQQAVDEYILLDHTEPVPQADLLKAESLSFYLPMHYVFDASALLLSSS